MGGRVFVPRNEKEMIRILKMAILNQKQVSIRGCSHSMGGQIITPNGGYVLDMKLFNDIVEYDAASSTIVVQSGIKWEQMIQFLNERKMSVDILQLYCSFSVGGSISVNAHGITADYALYKSIVEIHALIIGEDMKIKKVSNHNECPIRMVPQPDDTWSFM